MGLKDATLHLLKYACPLFIINEELKTFELIGTSVPIIANSRRFLLTAGHVADYKKDKKIYYPTDKFNGSIGCSSKFIGRTYTTACQKRDDDKFDFAIMEIEAKNLSEKFDCVPSYMIEKNFHLSHVDKICLSGFPATKNKPKFQNRVNDLKPTTYNLKQVDHKEYFKNGLNPIQHFCVRFDPKRNENLQGNTIIAPDPHGISGGPAWHLTDFCLRNGTDEGAILLGLTIEQKVESKIIWGIRISSILRSMVKIYPSLNEYFNLKQTFITNDIEDLKLFNQVKET